jgi:hypothetical protein
MFDKQRMKTARMEGFRQACLCLGCIDLTIFLVNLHVSGT